MLTALAAGFLPAGASAGGDHRPDHAILRQGGPTTSPPLVHQRSSCLHQQGNQIQSARENNFYNLEVTHPSERGHRPRKPQKRRSRRTAQTTPPSPCTPPAPPADLPGGPGAGGGSSTALAFFSPPTRSTAATTKFVEQARRRGQLGALATTLGSVTRATSALPTPPSARPPLHPPPPPPPPKRATGICLDAGHRISGPRIGSPTQDDGPRHACTDGARQRMARQVRPPAAPSRAPRDVKKPQREAESGWRGPQ